MYWFLVSLWLEEGWACCLEVYRVYRRFGQDWYDVFGFKQESVFWLMAKPVPKMLLTTKVVKRDTQITLWLLLSRLCLNPWYTRYLCKNKLLTLCFCLSTRLELNAMCCDTSSLFPSICINGTGQNKLTSKKTKIEVWQRREEILRDL